MMNQFMNHLMSLNYSIRAWKELKTNSKNCAERRRTPALSRKMGLLGLSGLLNKGSMILLANFGSLGGSIVLK